ncbi:hypothetical protein [Citrobacter youngae]|uniref:Uncharacterized protein n=1 Tax=Citrobacter youngae ATCC 29220 TaxID=500640 RepID=D4BAG3_9ENTR|nr:hypothetical protein [Citrobacter youngae]EFE09174.1 hypothetical protein CIT292_07457 [Citrobacter youngae ATCC 29220]
MPIAAPCETKLKTAALVHNTFNEVGRIGGFFFPAGTQRARRAILIKPAKLSPEGALIFFAKYSVQR